MFMSSPFVQENNRQYFTFDIKRRTQTEQNHTFQPQQEGQFQPQQQPQQPQNWNWKEPLQIYLKNDTPKAFSLALSLTLLVGLALGVYKYFSQEEQQGKRSPPSILGMKSLHKQATSVDVSFEDVIGCEEAKEQLREIVGYLRDPAKFDRIGAKLPKGILLVGQPGTGKTLLARAIAGEADVPFLHCNGSEFDEMFVGLGSARVRRLFEEAKRNSPSIIFIDEIDTFGTRKRPQVGQIRQDNPSLTQLLSEMDGFEKNSGIILIGATNLPDALDPALKRSGRFDRMVTVLPPDLKVRNEMLKYYLSKVVMGPDITDSIIKRVAQATVGMTGADLANLVNQAAVKAATSKRATVEKSDLDEAYDDLILGPARKSLVMPEKEKRLTAYHESGHALVAWHTQDSGSYPIRKATILPRGKALGYVAQVPKDDVLSYSRKELLAKIAVAMGGQLAEQMIFGEDELTSGASSDLNQASHLAREMVMKCGMSDKFGPRYINTAKDRGSLLSGKLKDLCDQEVKKILLEQQIRAHNILIEHEKQLHLLAEALIKHETLSNEEISLVLNGGTLSKE
eukprot:CAMPEP_0201479468 /NCGR_PEP_ID=MMETSP0151_2-20130828/4171_1 /ASSEMBLY_ACC=CAM_ASM_000257 /TAXON_ID=200890 /ORGANISM="Paramoeba atlantica, Strain 621/1 / CCAP 1560/9" /LENGTH=566 /DNA_ID=CAMNT_0047860977 /DNA_START=154 /DNA_END=1854 /DNA_ORIENTATION=+